MWTVRKLWWQPQGHHDRRFALIVIIIHCDCKIKTCLPLKLLYFFLLIQDVNNLEMCCRGWIVCAGLCHRVQNGWTNRELRGPWRSRTRDLCSSGTLSTKRPFITSTLFLWLSKLSQGKSRVTLWTSSLQFFILAAIVSLEPHMDILDQWEEAGLACKLHTERTLLLNSTHNHVTVNLKTSFFCVCFS